MHDIEFDAREMPTTVRRTDALQAANNCSKVMQNGSFIKIIYTLLKVACLRREHPSPLATVAQVGELSLQID